MKQLNWADFDVCVQLLTERYRGRSFKGVFGIPRGGLCLAVGLSHSLGIPLLTTPDNQCLIVDDVFETCLLYTSPSPRDRTRSRMPSSA